jgi:broad specificity phosphatase PhoE
MSEVLFVRHAETALAGTFCGHMDPEVNEGGRLQIDALIEMLRGERVDAIYTSDLRRAVQTAEGVGAAFDVRWELRPGLREINFGAWEGLRWEEIEARDAAYALRWLEEYPKLAAPRGEDFESFRERVVGEVTWLLESVRGRRVVVVTHGGVLRVVLRRWLGASEDEAWARTKEYCCVIRWTGGDDAGV